MSQNVTEEEASPPDRVAEVGTGKSRSPSRRDIETLHKSERRRNRQAKPGGDRRPERKGVASKSRHLRNEQRPENAIAWPSGFQAE